MSTASTSSSSSSTETQLVPMDLSMMTLDDLKTMSGQLVFSTFNLNKSLATLGTEVSNLVGAVGTIKTTVANIEVKQHQQGEQLTRMEREGAQMKAVQAEQGQKIDQIEDNVAQLADPINRQVSTTNHNDLALIAAIRRFGFNYLEGLGFAYAFYRGQDLCIGFNLDLMLMVIKATYGPAAQGNDAKRPSKDNTWGQKAGIQKTLRGLHFSDCNANDMEDWIKDALRFVPAAYYGKLPKNKKTAPTNHSQWMCIQAKRLADILQANDTLNATTYTNDDDKPIKSNIPEYQCFINREINDTEDVIAEIRKEATKARAAQVVNLARLGRFCEGPRTETVNKAFFEALQLLRPKVANKSDNRLILKAYQVPETHTFKGHMYLAPISEADNVDNDEEEEDIGLSAAVASPKSPVAAAPVITEEKKETRTRARKRKADDEAPRAAAPWNVSESEAAVEAKAAAKKKPKGSVKGTAKGAAKEPEFLMNVNLPQRSSSSSSSSSSK